MSLPSKFFRIPKGGLEDVISSATACSIGVIRHPADTEFVAKPGGEGVHVGIEIQTEQHEYLCIVAVHVSPDTLQLLERVCDIIVDCGGIEIGGNEIPNT